MAPVRCADVRRLLASLGGGPIAPADLPVFETLLANGAVQGTPAAPEITPIGRHVALELDVRAARTDPLPLDLVAEEITRVLNDLTQVAKTSEYFLAELGPIAPAGVLPLLRPVAVGLANRRETPEELAREFRNVWGGVEVMGGRAEDRLLAAEILLASSADLEQLYAPLMSTALRIRETAGPSAPAVTSAALLLLGLPPGARPALERFQSLRKLVGNDEAAALLAGGAPGEDRVPFWRGFLDELNRGVDTPASDAPLAAAFLAASGADRQRAVPRVKTLLGALSDKTGHPWVAASLLATISRLPEAELLNWLDKAVEIATAQKLAPTKPEVQALAIGLVHGLPEAEFAVDANATAPPSDRPARVSLPALVALHAWIYRPLVHSNPAVAQAASPS